MANYKNRYDSNLEIINIKALLIKTVDATMKIINTRDTLIKEAILLEDVI